MGDGYSLQKENLVDSWDCYIKSQSFKPDTCIRSVVADSWRRCFKLQVDPFQPKVSKISGEKLKEAIRLHQDMIDIARPYMRSLYNLVSGSGFVVTLCDEDGNLLELLGDPQVLADANNINLVPGVNWSEAYMGTTAIGITLEIKEPVQVCSAEHYCLPCHEWTCSAAPICDAQANLQGVLNMSGHYLKVHPHTLGMVVAAAQAIEQQIKTQQYSRNLLANNKYLKTVLETMSEGVISLDAAQQVTQMNLVAARMLELDLTASHGRPLPQALFDQLKLGEVLRGLEINDNEVSLDYNGKKSHCTVSAKPIMHDGQRPVGTVITLREIRSVRRLVHRMMGARALFTFEDILTNSVKMKKTLDMARLAALNDFTILIMGESGTGKELIAQAIHNASPRNTGPFVAVNCAAVPKELIGSEMFGYTEGAFTGAKSQGSPGKFELADGGTIFLDEIGDMPLDMQAALLRVTQERAVVRIGGRRVIPVNVRIIAATNKNLPNEVARGNFRNDLFYRFNEFPIRIPPLRQRPEDIAFLAHCFLERLSKKLSRRISFSLPALSYLERHVWLGNVRELENFVQQLAYLHKENSIGLEAVQALLEPASSPEAPDACLSLDGREKEAIQRALKATRGNISKAAQLLCIGRTTLYRKLEKYDIKP